MELKTFLIILIFVLLLAYCCKINKLENFDVPEHGYVHRPDIMEDPLFKDVKTYNNDDNPYMLGQRNGLEKCLNECEGRCVEFGVTGLAFCFPKEV